MLSSQHFLYKRNLFLCFIRSVTTSFTVFNWRVITPHIWCGGQAPLVLSVNTTRAEGKHQHKQQ